MSSPKRVLIVGGVAGGASCAARLRRLDEACSIVVLERGPFVSFANCGLPYHVGGVIEDEGDLLLASPELFRDRFRIEVRPLHEAVSIDRARREVEVRDSAAGRTYREAYDALVIAPGAAPVRPPLPGVDLPGVFTMRTIPDARSIRAWIEAKGAARAVVVGAGFIGLEAAENLRRRGLAVSVIEALPQVFPPLDPEMAHLVAAHLEREGVHLLLGDPVSGFEAVDEGVAVRTQSGAAVAGDVVLLSIGVRPETALARSAGLSIGARGGIVVDASMRTSDSSIWAVGDAVEVRDVVLGVPTVVPLAGPANRQGRIAAAAVAGREAAFRGVQGTAVCGVLGLTVAMTGASEKALRRAGVAAFDRVWLHPNQHAGYFPGAKPIHLKVLFARDGGRLLGAQAVGEEGVEKRIDVLAAMIQKNGTVFDLEEAELCYAPQYGSAKDPVNLAGMIAANALRGDAPLADWDSLGRTGALLLDVRSAEEFAAGAIPGAVNVPVDSLRDRFGEIPRGREVMVYCGVGQRAHVAVRILRQAGLDARNLSGGIRTYRAMRAAGRIEA